jgi:hypothetical protein
LLQSFYSTDFEGNSFLAPVGSAKKSSGVDVMNVAYFGDFDKFWAKKRLAFVLKNVDCFWSKLPEFFGQNWKFLGKLIFLIIILSPGANPMNSAFTTTTPAL